MNILCPQLRHPGLSSLACWFRVLAALPVVALPGAEIQFKPSQPLYAGAFPLAPGTYAIPCVADWNADGRKDLLVGYQGAGKIALYLNSGSETAPSFTTNSNLQAGGQDIVHLSGGCGSPAPFVCDYNGDGKRDVLVGEGNNGYVFFYQNTNTDSAPLLAPGSLLTVGVSPLTVGVRATPCVCDWNGDGLNDLLCGNGDGYIYYFRNTGAESTPTYAPGVRLQSGGADLNLGIRAVPRRFDWDGDGLADLLGSSDTGVYWCRNSGSAESPVLQAPVPLRAPIAGTGLANINTGYRMRLHLVDWNNDGCIDLLLGNLDGTVFLYEGYCFLAGVLPPQTDGRIVLQWNSAPFLRYHILAGSSVTTITNHLVSSVPSAGNATFWTNQVSEPRQFYRVQVAN